MVKINFEETLEPIEVAEDLSFMTFTSLSKDKQETLLKVSISPLGDPLLANVYNLAFGPLDENGNIDDICKVNHANIHKMFSTILFFCLTFLRNNPTATIGIDGSNDVRAYLYHRMFLTNREYLSEFFITIGVDWYVRLLRNGTVELDKNGLPFFKPKPESFDYQRNTNDLYRYYMFQLA